MPRLETSISADYLQYSWGTYEGVREIIQNARDAEIEHNSELEVSFYNNKEGQLRIENKGVTLSHENLLMGNTSKADRDDLIGKWGEGLKVGILALLRNGKNIKIRTGSETWVPNIERSKYYKSDVLVFNISTGNKYNNRVRIEISPFSKSDWKEYKNKFLFLSPKYKDLTYQNKGTILRDPRYKGKIYSQGLFVTHRPNTKYGYNLNLHLDRDRRILDDWEVKSSIKDLWQEEARKTGSVKDFYELLQEGSEVPINPYLNSSTVALLKEEFHKEYGEKAFPVLHTGEATKLEHFGVKGIPLSRALYHSLSQGGFPSLDEFLSELALQKEKTYSLRDLEEEEKENFLWAKNILTQISTNKGDNISIVSFKDPLLKGLYSDKDETIEISRTLLKDKLETLGTLIHEQAHTCGEDGDKLHIFEIEHLWKKATKILMA